MIGNLQGTVPSRLQNRVTTLIFPGPKEPDRLIILPRHRGFGGRETKKVRERKRKGEYVDGKEEKREGRGK